MQQNKYDIFISYRRDSGAQYARILQLMLMQRGYKVFLDYDELTDGINEMDEKLDLIAAALDLIANSLACIARALDPEQLDKKKAEMLAQLAHDLAQKN